jgi:hypothetical protein
VRSLVKRDLDKIECLTPSGLLWLLIVQAIHLFAFICFVIPASVSALTSTFNVSRLVAGLIVVVVWYALYTVVFHFIVNRDRKR